MTTFRRIILPWAATATVLTLCLMPITWVPHEITFWERIQLDKMIHFGMFAGFGMAWACAGASPVPTRTRVFGVLAAAFALAVGTEMAQGLPQVHRDPDPFDALADAVGAVAGVGAVAALIRERSSADDADKRR